MAGNPHLREIAACLDEALRVQSRIMDLTEQVYEAAGMRSGDRTLRGKVTGLFFGIQAHLDAFVPEGVSPRQPKRRRGAASTRSRSHSAVVRSRRGGYWSVDRATPTD